MQDMLRGAYMQYVGGGWGGGSVSDSRSSMEEGAGVVEREMQGARAYKRETVAGVRAHSHSYTHTHAHSRVGVGMGGSGSGYGSSGSGRGGVVGLEGCGADGGKGVGVGVSGGAAVGLEGLRSCSGGEEEEEEGKGWCDGSVRGDEGSEGLEGFVSEVLAELRRQAVKVRF